MNMGIKMKLHYLLIASTLAATTLNSTAQADYLRPGKSHVGQPVADAGNSQILDQSQTSLLMRLQLNFQEMQHEVQSLKGQVEELTHTVQQLRMKEGSGAMTSTAPIVSTPSQAGTGTYSQTIPLYTPPDQDVYAGPIVDEAPITTKSEHPPIIMGAHNLDSSASQDHYNLAKQKLEHHDLEGATQEFLSFIDRYPNDPLIVNVHYWLGETHLLKNDPKEAASEFATAYSTYKKRIASGQPNPFESRLPEIMLKMAASLKNADQPQQAIVSLNQLDKEFPWAPQNVKDQANILRQSIIGG
jgi:TolA-binding protein